MSGAVRNAPVAIVGGCGFIGSNLADSLLTDNVPVTLVDNLSRQGVEQNLSWLRSRHGEGVRMVRADIRDFGAVRQALDGAKAVFHLAAQTAVTTSLDDPFGDFDINARGTLNVLEAVRRCGRKIPVIFASTNKVYGALENIEIVTREGRCMPASGLLAAHGVDEDRPLSFRTPYGCSKGVADQYVLDYSASYGMQTAVLRMSCIYGPRQFGTEDQGWVAHFLIRALAGQPITLFGDGAQVRDVLHVGDAVAAYRMALARIAEISGSAFNLGGGPANAVSLNMVLKEISAITGRMPRLRHAGVRTGDQRYFVADTRRIEAALGWRARFGWREGMRDLARWLESRGEAETATERVVA